MNIPPNLLSEPMIFDCLQATVMIALLQPAEETYRLFDDIMLLSDGRPLQTRQQIQTSSCTGQHLSIRGRVWYF